MGVKLFRATVSTVAVMAIINAFQVQPAKAFEIKIPNPLGLLMEGIGIKTYKLTVAYQKFLSPYIRNQGVYDKLIEDYGGKKQFSGKAGVNVIIKLGILRKHPKWLNATALDEIRRFYPIAERRTEIHELKINLISAESSVHSGNFAINRANLFVQYAQATPDIGAGVAAGITTAELVSSLQGSTRAVALAVDLPVAASAAAVTMAAILVFELNRDALFKYLTPEAQALLVSAENIVCQNVDGGCTRTSAPSTKSGGGRDWQCTAQCNVQQIDRDAICTPRVNGVGSGPTETIACNVAKRDATSQTPRGCYPRHCYCNCR